MDIFLFSVAYLSLTAFFIFILLFGESPVFKGTPVAALHWLVTTGFRSGFEWLLHRLCGTRGSRALDSCIIACCERPNPALQIAYAVMVLGGFAIYWTNLFSLLPNPWVDESHILSGSVSVLASVALFVAASLSDPGTVRPHPASDLAAWHRLYPLDDTIFPAKECPTCKLMRPARSKHCRVCNRCVGRHDHHCQWINNCVGFNNMRIFLAFLVANLAMCAYGAMLAGLILGGEMERRGMFSVRLVNYRTGKVLPLWKVPSKLMEWLIVYYPVGVAMFIFMAVATLLLAAFFLYQIYLLAIGRTQYEVFKWRELHHTLLELAEQEAEEEERRVAEQEAREEEATEGTVHGAAGATSRPDSSPVKRGSWWSRLWGSVCSCGGGRGSGSQGRTRRCRRLTAAKVSLPPNIYNKGFWANTWEVLLPELYFQRARQVVARPGSSSSSSHGAVSARGLGSAASDTTTIQGGCGGPTASAFVERGGRAAGRTKKKRQ